MALIADGLLIATCLTAAIYCYVLSRRLKQFSSTEDGVGKQVRELNTALQETRAALKETQGSAAAEAEALAREVANARVLSTRLKDLIAQAEKVGDRAPSAVRQAVPRSAPVSAPDPVEDDLPSVPKKLEAVSHEQAMAPPQPEPEAPPEPEDDIDPAEMNLDEMLQSGTGEHQLGFLPEDDDDAQDEAPAVAPSESAPAAPAAQAGASESGDNLLKVERMAL